MLNLLIMYIMYAFYYDLILLSKFTAEALVIVFNEVLNIFQTINHTSKLKACSRQRKISFQMAPNCIQSTTNWKFYIYTFSLKYTVNGLL